MTTYITATGLILPVSQTPTNWVAGTAAAETQIGTSANDVFQGLGGDLLVGGDGDDAYYLWDNTSAVVEQGGQGIDTIYANYWGAVTLPDYVENLFLSSSGSTSGTGNGLNNIIVAGSVGATLDGGGGDDVLVGGAGADLFKITAGNGSDAVVNFKPSSDVIQLQGYGISSFDQLKALGAQVGSDVQFAFANGEKLVVRDVSLSDLSAYDFGLPPTLAALPPGYSELVGPGNIVFANGWAMFNNVWNAGDLESGDFSIISSFKASDLTDHPTFNWSFPVVTEAVPTVRAYPEVSFGPNPLGSVQTAIPGAVFPAQLSALTGLTVTMTSPIKATWMDLTSPSIFG
jgi:serralysin